MLSKEMPKLYDYLGLTVFFYSNDHLPIHVHGRKERRENRAELVIIDGKIIQIRITSVEGRAPLLSGELKNFQLLVENRAEEIMNKWVKFFVENKSIEAETITRKLR